MTLSHIVLTLLLVVSFSMLFLAVAELVMLILKRWF